MKSEVGNCIDFANDTLKKKKRNVGEARVKYNMIKYKKIHEYTFLKTSVEMLPQFSGWIHWVSVDGNWIFDSNYEKSLVLNRASLDIIFALSVGEEQDAIFESVFTAVRYIYSRGKFKKG